MRRAPNLARFRRRLLAWYRHNARPLPWRATSDPYRIWVSEIMLQQTRVAAVLAHYRAFLERFPDVRALAQASEDEVLAAWSGLGYYRRARMLHAAARVVLRAHQGKLPRTVDALRKLPGVGRYTAAAIASIAFAVPVAVVDGNVERVLGRLRGQPMSPADTWQQAQALLAPPSAPTGRAIKPGDFNQAMMELGAKVCLPEKPRCGACPVAAFCVARGALPSKPAAVRRKQATSYTLARRNGSVRLVRRAANASLMPGMWELPAAIPNSEPLLRLRHSITTTDHAVTVFATPAGRKGKWVDVAKLSELPLTGLTRKILRRVGLLH